MIIALFIFGILIFVHEFGHFISARIFKVPINEFAIGMGPKIVSKTSKKTNTVYSLRAFPIGGFVSMVGEDEESDNPNALNRKPVYQRFIICAAGAVMNLLLGIIVMSILVITSETLPSTTIFRFVDDNALSNKTGLMINDTITKVDGVRVYTANDMVYEVMRSGTEPIDITVKRGGETVVVENVEFPTITEQGIKFGNIDFYVTAEEKNFVNVTKHAVVRSASTIKMIWDSLIDLVTGKYGLEQVSGPVGVTEVIGEAAERSMPDLLYLSVVISMNLGIFNLLPLPALDGGRLVFLLIEGIRRKPINPKYEGYVHFAGIVALMLLMVVITLKDILNLFG